jgi:hypothetical protein
MSYQDETLVTCSSISEIIMGFIPIDGALVCVGSHNMCGFEPTTTCL